MSKYSNRTNMSWSSKNIIPQTINSTATERIHNNIRNPSLINQHIITLPSQPIKPRLTQEHPIKHFSRHIEYLYNIS